MIEPATEPVPTPDVPPASEVPAHAPPAYGGIDDVPELVIHTEALADVSEYGARASDDLCGAVSRRLGFKRLGPKSRPVRKGCWRHSHEAAGWNVKATIAGGR